MSKYYNNVGKTMKKNTPMNCRKPKMIIIKKQSIEKNRLVFVLISCIVTMEGGFNESRFK